MVFYVNMVTFRMIPLIINFINIVMDDGGVIQWPKPCLLLSATCDEILSKMIRIWLGKC